MMHKIILQIKKIVKAMVFWIQNSWTTPLTAISTWIMIWSIDQWGVC